MDGECRGLSFVEMQEVAATLALELDSNNVLALRTRAHCRQHRLDLHGCQKDLTKLQNLGCKVYMVWSLCTLKYS